MGHPVDKQEMPQEHEESIDQPGSDTPRDLDPSELTGNLTSTQKKEHERKEKMLSKFFEEVRRGSSDPLEHPGGADSLDNMRRQTTTTPGPSVIGITSPERSDSRTSEKCANTSKSSVCRELFPAVPHQTQSRQKSAEPEYPKLNMPIEQREQPQSSQGEESNPFQGHSIERKPAKMLLRAADLIRLPARFAGLAMEAPETDCPQSLKEATEGPERHSWETAVEEELEALRANRTWEIVDRPASGCTLTAKWVFTKKRDIQGNQEGSGKAV